MARKPLDGLACPQSRHAGSALWKRGTRTDAAGNVWQRYECRPEKGKPHKFRILVENDPKPVVYDPTPQCPDPEHRQAGAVVVRNGSYGRRVRRQRYCCTRIDEAGVKHRHWFVAELPRDHVAGRQAHCHECEVLIGVHRGDPASSPRSSWPLAAVVEALSELSQGSSYAQASVNLWARAELARTHLATHAAEAEGALAEDEPEETAEDEPATDGPPAEPPADEALAEGAATVKAEKSASTASWRSERGRSAWHLAADLVEQYAPVLHAEALAPVVAAEQELRVENDEIKHAGGVPDRPIAFIADEIPIYLKTGDAPSRMAWTVLTVATVAYRPGKRPGDPPGTFPMVEEGRAAHRAGAQVHRHAGVP